MGGLRRLRGVLYWPRAVPGTSEQSTPSSPLAENQRGKKPSEMAKGLGKALCSTIYHNQDLNLVRLGPQVCTTTPRMSVGMESC
jgi:hypothetical protein